MMPTVLTNINIIGCRGTVDSVDKFLAKANDFVSNLLLKDDILLQFLDADMVLGKEHILSAIEHADRAFQRKENISETLAMEILIYTAGEPQIKNALAKIGLRDGCERIAIITGGINTKALEALMDHLHLEQDDGVLEFNELKAREFGINEREISAVKKDKRRDLVLERVALVEVRR